MDADEVAIPPDITYSKQLPRKEPLKSIAPWPVPEDRFRTDVMLSSETSATHSLPSLEPEQNEVAETLKSPEIEVSAGGIKTIEMQVKERLRNMVGLIARHVSFLLKLPVSRYDHRPSRMI